MRNVKKLPLIEKENLGSWDDCLSILGPSDHRHGQPTGITLQPDATVDQRRHFQSDIPTSDTRWNYKRIQNRHKLVRTGLKLHLQVRSRPCQAVSSGHESKIFGKSDLYQLFPIVSLSEQNLVPLLPLGVGALYDSIPQLPG